MQRVLPRCFHRHPDDGIDGPWTNAFWQPYPIGTKMLRSDGSLRLRHWADGGEGFGQVDRLPGLHVITLLDDVVVLDRRLRPTPTITQLLDNLSRQVGGSLTLAESPATGASAFVAQAHPHGHGALPTVCAASCALVRGDGLDALAAGDVVSLVVDVLDVAGRAPRVAVDWWMLWAPALSFGRDVIVAEA